LSISIIRKFFKLLHFQVTTRLLIINRKKIGKKHGMTLSPEDGSEGFLQRLLADKDQRIATMLSPGRNIKIQKGLGITKPL